MAAEARFVAVTSGALIAYNAIVHLTPGYDALYVPLNLALTAILLAAARRHGLTAADLAAERRFVSHGLRWGAAAAAVAGVALAIAVAVPGLHGLLEDARVAGIGIAVLAYRTLVRIPLGTVLLEEVAFRGVLLGAWARWQGIRRAVVGSSVVFGLWHIRPAVDLLNENDLAGSLAGRIPAVAGLVAFTAGAGVVFCLLRLRSRSLAAPLLAHAAVNSLATVAAFVVRPNSKRAAPRGDEERPAASTDSSPQALRRFDGNDTTGERGRPSAGTGYRGHMARYVELRRHTDNEGDVLSEVGVRAALVLGRHLAGSYRVVVTSGAQRATQTAACLMAALADPVPGGVVVEPGLRSAVEDQWRAAFRAAGAGDLESLRAADPDLVRTDSVALAAGLQRVFDRLEDGERALAIGHSPTNEAAVLGLTGTVIPPLGKGEGVLVIAEADRYSVEALD